MEVVVEKLSNLKRKLTVAVSAEDIDKKTDAKLEQLKNKVKISGFRPGKVPLAVVKQRYGKSARQEVIADTISSTYFKALQDNNLQPAGQPHIEPNESKFGDPLRYIATFEIYPEIKLQSLAEVKVEKLDSKVTDNDVSEMLLKLRKQHATWKEVERVAENGDQLVIDFEGKIKSEKFKGGDAKDFKFEIGAGSMLEDFEKPLLKTKAGNEVKFKFKFPKDYTDESVAGKKAEFVVKVHKVLNPELPELDKQFCEKLGIENGDVDNLKKTVRENMERELKQTLEIKFRNSVLDKLIAQNPLEIPDVMLDGEIHMMQNRMKEQVAQYAGQKVTELPDYPKEQFEKEARRRVHLGLLLSEMIKKQNLKVEPEAVKAKITELALGYNVPAEAVINWYYQDKNRLESVESMILEEQVVEKLKKEVIVVTKNVGYKDAMKQEAKEDND